MNSIDLLPPPTGSEQAARPLLHRLPPLSLATVGVFLLALFVVAQAAHGFTDPDYWWHFKTGQYIVAHRTIPHVDVFSSTAAGRPWVTHEWLSEAIIYLLVRSGGYGLALAFCTLSSVLSILLLFRLLGKEGVAPLAGLPVAAISAVMIAIFGTVRPQILSWLCFSILIAALYAHRSGRVRRLWGIPLLFLLWANLHLSFLIGLAMLGVYVAALAADQRLNRRPLHVGHPLGVLTLSAAAACLNPNGPRLLLYPLVYLRLQNTANSVIDEWKSPDFHSSGFLPLLAALMVLLAVGLSPRRLDLWALGLGLLTVGLALQSTRYMPVFAIAFVPLAGTALSQRWSWARAGSPAPPSPARSLFHWSLLAFAGLTLIVTFRPGPWSEFQAAPRTEGQLVPVHAVDVIAEQFPDARIFNQYEWGGYLIYRLWPRQRPFIDGRDDLFGQTFANQYFDAWAAKPGWEETLDRYGVNLVIVRGDTSLAGALQTNPTWRLASKDDLAVVYVRAEGSSGAKQ